MLGKIFVFLFKPLLQGQKAQDVSAKKPKDYQVTSDKVRKISHLAPPQIPQLRSAP